jgi:hypothetical protein
LGIIEQIIKLTGQFPDKFSRERGATCLYQKRRHTAQRLALRVASKSTIGVALEQLFAYPEAEKRWQGQKERHWKLLPPFLKSDCSKLAKFLAPGSFASLKCQRSGGEIHVAPRKIRHYSKLAVPDMGEFHQ